MFLCPELSNQSHIKTGQQFFFFEIYSLPLFAGSRLLSRALAGARSEPGQPITSKGHSREKRHQTFFTVWR